MADCRERGGFHPGDGKPGGSTWTGSASAGGTSAGGRCSPNTSAGGTSFGGTSVGGTSARSASATRNFQLADLLTAGGAAMGRANTQLTASNAPALLQSYNLTLTFPGSVRIGQGATGLRIMRPQPSRCAAPPNSTASITIAANYIAAPSLLPVPPT